MSKHYYLVSEDCIEKVLCKTMNMTDELRKHLLIQVNDIAKEMIKESVDVDGLMRGLKEIKDLAGMDSNPSVINIGSLMERIQLIASSWAYEINDNIESVDKDFKDFTDVMLADIKEELKERKDIPGE